MPRLTDSATYMQELSTHIISREGVYKYFYVDNEGFVTIGIGHLVDNKEAVKAQHEASKFALAQYVNFKTAQGAPVTSSDEVVEDWQRVKDHYEANPTVKLKAKDYKTVAQLRMTQDGIEKLLQLKIKKHADDMITQRSFMTDVDEQIQMALVDARYNPAGIGLYKSSPADLPKMWDALNKNKTDFDLQKALKYFRNIWKGRGGKNKERYGERHMLRVGMFARGVEKQLGLTQKIDINTL